MHNTSLDALIGQGCTSGTTLFLVMDIKGNVLLDGGEWVKPFESENESLSWWFEKLLNDPIYGQTAKRYMLVRGDMRRLKPIILSHDTTVVVRTWGSLAEFSLSVPETVRV